MSGVHQIPEITSDQPVSVHGLTDARALAPPRRISMVRDHFARLVLHRIPKVSLSRPALCFAALVLIGQVGLARQDTAYTIPELVQEMSPGVVSVAVVDRDGNVLTRGSGFIVDSSGLIVTAHHLIDGAVYAMVKTQDGEIYDRIDVVDYDRRRDVAIISIRPFSVLQALKLAPMDNLVIGEGAVAIGNPQGFDHSVSEGLISGYRQMTGYRLIQTTAPLSPGSSGGPLFTMDGSVVGLTNYQLSADRTQNLNFAVPIAYVRTLLDRPSSPMPLEEFATRMERAPTLPDTSDPSLNRSTWRVIHDHLSSEFVYGCQGEMFVSPEGLRFETNDSDHSFGAVWRQVELVGGKPEWGWGAFGVVLRRPRGRTYNFRIVAEGTGEIELEDLLEVAARFQR